MKYQPLQQTMLLTALLSVVLSHPSYAQGKPVATVVEGAIDAKYEAPRYETLTTGKSIYQGALLRAKPGSKVKIRCNSNQVDWRIPDDGVPRGVSNYCS